MESQGSVIADWDAARQRQRIQSCLNASGLTAREINLASEKFIVTDDNRKAFESAEEFKNGGINLLLCGGAGRGKSLIALRIVHEACTKGVPAQFWTTARYLMRLRALSLETNDEDALKTMTKARVIVLDDFGANKITEWSLMMMDAVVDEWYRQGSAGIVITSNFTLQQIGSDISDRIASRLAEMFRVFEMRGRDWRVSKPKPIDAETERLKESMS